VFRGVKGGYSFARVPETISVLEVVELLDGPVGGVWPRAVRQRSRQQRRPRDAPRGERPGAVAALRSSEGQPDTFPRVRRRVANVVPLLKRL
jgi:hypothetical protein